jgi:hypothetical protein
VTLIEKLREVTVIDTTKTPPMTLILEDGTELKCGPTETVTTLRRNPDGEEAATALETMLEALEGLLGQVEQGHMAHNFAQSPSTQSACDKARAAIAKVIGDRCPRHEQALADLRYLLSFPRLGEWGMDTLKDTLSILLPNEKLHD